MPSTNPTASKSQQHSSVLPPSTNTTIMVGGSSRNAARNWSPTPADSHRAHRSPPSPPRNRRGLVVQPPRQGNILAVRRWSPTPSTSRRALRSPSPPPTALSFDEDAPSLYKGTGWHKMIAEDYERVYNNEAITTDAYFFLAYQIVKTHNKASHNSAVGLVHHQFNEAHERNSNEPIRNHMFFTDCPTDYIVIPMFKTRHFFLVLVSYTQREVLVVDSDDTKLWGGKNVIKKLIATLRDVSSRFPIIYKKPTECYQQGDTDDCGVCTNRNIETLLENGHLEMAMDIAQLRKNYGDRLARRVHNGDLPRRSPRLPQQ